MRIAVSSKGAGLGAWLEPDINKCGFLVVVDDDLKFNAIENTGNIPELIDKAIHEEIQAIIVGNLDDQTINILKENNIEIFITRQGNILELAEQAKTNNLEHLS